MAGVVLAPVWKTGDWLNAGRSSTLLPSSTDDQLAGAASAVSKAVGLIYNRLGIETSVVRQGRLK